MKTLHEFYQYEDVVLIDTNGAIRLSVSDRKEPLGPDAKRFAAEAMRTKNVVFSDLYRNPFNKKIRLSLLVPLTILQGHDPLPIGCLLLRIDPNQFLYPLIQQWPAQSRTAESLLIRREENEVVFLNESRHQKNTALNLRFPISEEHLPASVAARGIEGVIEGIDYRGIPVLAAKAVPDTPWFLISKVDQEEVFSILYKRARFIGIITILLTIAAGLGLGLIWGHQNAEHYRKQYDTEHDRQLYLQRYEYLTKYANDIILLADTQGKIMDFNERAVATYGYTNDELLHMNLKDLRSPETRSVLSGQIKEAEEQNGLVFEISHQKKDGTVFPVEVSSRIIKVDGNTYYQSIIRDITERKIAEEELRKYREDLEELISERTARLEYINKELEAFSYSVSHDLRAPLRHIVGFVELLQKRALPNLDESSRRYLNNISDSAHNMSILIDDLLSFSHIGRAEMIKTKVSLNELVKDVIQDSKEEIKGRDIIWEVSELPEVHGDKTLLRLVLMNLISNAVKFATPRTKQNIEIGYSSDNNDMTFLVRDNGVGFDMKYVDKLFGVFQRLHSKTEFEGTGIGLANVKRIIQRHGGKVWASGKVNEGATFFFTLPKEKKNAG